MSLAGVKFDGGKPQFSLVPADALAKVAEVLMFGAKKYTRSGWKSVPNARQRYLDAMLRHVWEYSEGKRVDDESGLATLAHAGCCLLFCLWFDLHPEAEVKEEPTK